MTEPKELLEERFLEIKEVRDSAKRNNLPEEDMCKLDNIYHKYLVCINLMDTAFREVFVHDAEVYKSSKQLFIQQHKEIKSLKYKLSRAK
jgi:hypothetical protein|tara:strand:+ start:1855 stop:2124 length:270 start_codon:yes stop_codon:yes gene_type:complete